MIIGKFKITIMGVILLCSISFGIYIVIASGNSYENKGKKALINNKDTCVIVSEEKIFPRLHPRRIRVIYKDSYGKYTEQNFQEQMITILN